jgi:hypothetical protein
MDLGVRLFGVGLGIPALAFLAYSGIANAGLAWALAPNAADAAGYVLLALFISVAVGILPLAAGLLSESEKLKPLATMAWIAFAICFALTLAAASGHIEFTRQTTGHAAKEKVTPPNTDIRRMAAIEGDIALFHRKQHKIRIENNTLAVMSGETLLKYTKGCTSFAYADEREHCNDLAYYLREKSDRERLDGYKDPAKSWGLRDFVPEWAVSWLQIGATGYFHLLAAFLGPLMMAVTAGAIDFMMTPPAPAPSTPEPPTLTPEQDADHEQDQFDHFSEWHGQCVIDDPEAKGLSFDAIWKNYSKWCSINGFTRPPIAQPAFSKKFAALHKNEWGHSNGSKYDRLRLKNLE